MVENTQGQVSPLHKKGLQKKMLLATLLVGSLPVVLGLLLTYLKGTHELQKALGSNFTGLAKEAAGKADLIQSREIQNLRRLAEIPDVVELVQKSRRTPSGKTPKIIREETAQNQSEWNTARDAKTRDHPILTNSVSTYLAHTLLYRDEPESLVGLYITDERGVLRASSNNFPPFLSADSFTWKRTFADGTGKNFIGNIYQHGPTGRYLIDFGVPVFDSSGSRAIGTVIQISDVKELFKSAIHEIRFGDTGHAMLIDGAGNVLVCPILPTGMHVADPLLLDTIVSSTPHWAKVASDAHGGSNSIIGASPVSKTNRILLKSGSSPWYSFIRQEPRELYAPVRALMSHAVIASIALMGFLGFLAVIASRNFVKPIHLLHKGAELIGKGNLSHRLDIRTNDEVEQLADEFNRMAENLQESYVGLEKRVAERTNELRVLNTMALTVNQSLDLQKTLDDTLAQIMEVMEVEGGVIHHWDHEKEKLFLRSHKGLPDALIRAAAEIEEGEFVSGQVAKSGKMLVIEESQLKDYSQSPLVQGGFKSIIGVPIYSQNRLVATMAIASRAPRHFGASGIQLLSSIVNQIGTAIDHVSLYSREKKMVERLKEIDRFKSEFLSNVSHELRMPLTSIIGFSELLLDRIPGDLTPDQEDYVRNMQESGYHLLEIINNLLNLSKLRAGKMEVHYDRFGLPPLLENIKRTVTPLISKKGLNFSSELIGEIPEMFSDEGKIKQILLNLLSNAIKFTPGGGSISVQASVSSIDGRPAAEIRVMDTGIGIRPEDKAKIFDEFQQVDTSYTRDYPGTGLGLSITKQFVSLIGGKIFVESRYGKGSTFKIIVPLHATGETGLKTSPLPLTSGVTGGEKTESVPPPPAGAAAENREGDEAGPLPRILVIEDDPTVGRLLTLYLTQEGYHVDHAMDGEEALEKASLLKPFAITLDIMLPKKDGWEVLQRLRQNPETKDIPIIIVSIIENRDLGFSLGATDYFTKPIDRKALMDSLKKLNLPAKTRRKPVNMLVIDDDPKILQLISAIMETEGYGVLKSQDAIEGIDLAIEVQPDLILLDLLMPGISGFEALERLKEHPTAKNIPVIIFTGKSLSKEDQERINHKIRGMIPKGASLRESLLNEIRKFEKLYPDKAKMVDGLTGLYNERYLHNRLSDESSRALRIQRAFSLLLTNIDEFQSLNRQYGLETGNDVLREVSELIRKNSRTANPLCRCGGSTLAIILTETTKETAKLVGEKLRVTIEQTVFKTQAGKNHRRTISIGLATFFEDGTTPEKLMAQATWAMDQARAEGGNRVVAARNITRLSDETHGEL